MQHFNTTRHLRHMEAAAHVWCTCLYSLAFMADPAHGATLLYPVYTQPNACCVWTGCTNGLQIFSTRVGYKPITFSLQDESTNLKAGFIFRRDFEGFAHFFAKLMEVDICIQYPDHMKMCWLTFGRSAPNIVRVISIFFMEIKCLLYPGNQFV